MRQNEPTAGVGLEFSKVSFISMIAALLVSASAGLLPGASPRHFATAQKAVSPRSSVRLSTAGEELRACLLNAPDARQRQACFAGFSLEDLLDEGDLVSQSRALSKRCVLGGCNHSAGRWRAALGRLPKYPDLPAPGAFQISGGDQVSTQDGRMKTAVLETKQARR
jgi:hypothetical protein